MIYIVSTKVGSGKGGISTALVGYKALRQEFVQDVHFVASHGVSRFGGISAACTMLTKVKKNDIVWLHCGDWYSLLRKFAIGMMGKLKGAKVIVHFHAISLDNYLGSFIGRLLVKVLCRSSDGVIVLTPWWKKRLNESLPGLSTPIHIAPNPLDEQLSQATAEAKNRLASSNVRLLAMSRLVEGKGFEAAIKTLGLLPESYSLTIAGDGPLLPALQELAKKLNLSSRVTFLGWVDYQQKGMLFKGHDIFLLPSENDSFGMGFVEAMAFGLPVVALEHKAITDVVKHNHCGYLVKESNPEALAEAVCCCAENFALFSGQAQSYVAEHFSPSPIIEEINSFILRIRKC